MKNNLSRNLRLGLMVLLGTLSLIAALYLIGNKRNIFGNTFELKAVFADVNGLLPGNGVRLSGIDVGTVKEIQITSDTTIVVTMVIENKIRPFIRKNAIASIGTDGLMGNKIVNILGHKGNSPGVDDGDVLATREPVAMDEVTRTLSATNDNLKVITDNLRNITGKIESSNSLWSLLNDSTLSENLRNAIVSIRVTGQNSAIITGNLSGLINDVKNGKGTIGALITDTSLTGHLKQSIVSIQLVSDRMAVVSGDLGDITQQVKNGEGALGTIIMDTTFVGNLNQAVISAKQGAAGFDQNMEALKHSVFLRGYFRKQEAKKADTEKK